MQRVLWTIATKLNIETCACRFILLRAHNCFAFCISSFSYHTFSSLPSRLSARTIVELKVWFIEVTVVSVLYCPFLLGFLGFFPLRLEILMIMQSIDSRSVFFFFINNCCKIMCRKLMKFLSWGNLWYFCLIS